MSDRKWDGSSPPLYGCLTGVKLADGESAATIVPGVTLQRVFVDTFGATMMAFAPPQPPTMHHPAPWVAVQDGFLFKSRVELGLTDLTAFGGMSVRSAAWLVACLLRIRMPSPIRLAVVAGMPFPAMGRSVGNAAALPFENSPHHLGVFSTTDAVLSKDELARLGHSLKHGIALHREDRFSRALSIFDLATWSPTMEIAIGLIWTSMEILFDVSGEREKTKALSRAIGEYVGSDRRDRDRAYQVVKDLYYKRGQSVHAGRAIEPPDIVQSFQLAGAVFDRVLLAGTLPS